MSKKGKSTLPVLNCVVFPDAIVSIAVNSRGQLIIDTKFKRYRAHFRAGRPMRVRCVGLLSEMEGGAK